MNDEPDVAADAPLAFVIADQARIVVADKMRQGGYAQAGYVLTGEDASFKGVKPSQPYAIGGDGFGAVELVARVGNLSIDDDAFVDTAATRLANPDVSAKKADSYGVGVNWYLTQNAKLTADYNETRFEGGAAAGADRNTEKALFTRLTIQY